jgi:hypothetical protein
VQLPTQFLDIPELVWSHHNPDQQTSSLNGAYPEGWSSTSKLHDMELERLMMWTSNFAISLEGVSQWNICKEEQRDHVTIAKDPINAVVR